MVKQFSTARDTQRDTQSYTEKRRGRRETEVTRRRRGEVKRGESNQASDRHTPPFEENRLPFWVPGVLCQCSEVVLWKLLKIKIIFLMNL